MFKKLKLAPKLVLTIGSVLTVILVVLIGTTIFMSRRAISNATYEELEAISRSNAIQIQAIFDEAESVAQNMKYYVEQAYKTGEENPSWMVMPTERAAMELCTSSIYGAILTPVNYDIEVYLRETARKT